MNKYFWYKDRIEWRVKKNKLLNCHQVHRFDALDDENKRIIKDTIGAETEPLFVFWADSGKWTVLCVDSIYSHYDGSLQFCLYDDIQKKVSVRHPHKTKNNKELKENIEFIYLDLPNVSIWAPKGSVALGLINVLLMFPLQDKAHVGAVVM